MTVCAGSLIRSRFSWTCPGTLVNGYKLQPEDCSERGGLRSEEDSTATIIWFVNNTHEVLSLYWADYNGQEQSYGQIKPGDNLRQETYLTHPWVVTRGDGTCVGVYRPLRRPGVAVIR